jgi:hypothetical protein
MWYRVAKSNFGGGAIQEEPDVVSVIAPKTLNILNPEKISVINNNPGNEASPEDSSLEEQLSEVRDEEDVDTNMLTTERGKGSLFLYNGAGEYRAKSQRNEPMFWQNMPSNRTWV